MISLLSLTSFLGCSGGTQEALQQAQQQAQALPPSESTQWYESVAPDLWSALSKAGRSRGAPRDWIGVQQGECAWLIDAEDPLCSDSPQGLCPVQLFTQSDEGWSMLHSTTASDDAGRPAWLTAPECRTQLTGEGDWRPLEQHVGALGQGLPLPDCGILCPQDIPSWQQWERQEARLADLRAPLLDALTSLGVDEDTQQHANLLVGERCVWMLDTRRPGCSGAVSADCVATVFEVVSDVVTLRGMVPLEATCRAEASCRPHGASTTPSWPPNVHPAATTEQFGHRLHQRPPTQDTPLARTWDFCTDTADATAVTP